MLQSAIHCVTGDVGAGRPVMRAVVGTGHTLLASSVRHAPAAAGKTDMHCHVQVLACFLTFSCVVSSSNFMAVAQSVSACGGVAGMGEPSMNVNVGGAGSAGHTLRRLTSSTLEAGG